MYLTNMLKFYGVNQVEHVYIEGTDAHADQREQILARALTEATTKAKVF